MKKIDYRQEANEIINDYYHLLNLTFGTKYHTAKQYAIDMIQRRLDTEDLHPDDKERLFILKQEMLSL